ncbi:TraQ conjugal transfer family protein [Zobellia laminariae]|uniref:TraQ conjugal transfer family protein n=1 Tax=Zobellia laminariae TaxID=248906 RepID=UPI0012D899E5
MKKLTRSTRFSIAFLLGTFLIIVACSKDFEDVILDDFDFDFTGEQHGENFLFETSRTSFSLVPEKEITTVDYFVKYAPNNSKGHFLTMKGDIIRANDTLKISDRNWNYNYVAIDTGLHKVKFLAWDSNDNQKELELSYNAKYASFSFLLNKGVNEFIINSKNPVNVTLLRDKETANPEKQNDFEVTYQIENGTGKLYLDGQEFDAGRPFNLPKGISEMRYLPETLGEHKLIVTAKAPDGATLTEELLLNVMNLGFSINATAASTQVQLDTNLAIAIDLNTQDETSDVEYEITHSFASTSEGGGTVRDHNGGVMDAGQYRSIVPNSYNYTFTSTELGKRKIYFDIRDSNGQIKRDSVEIEVANIPFTFSGNSESNSVFPKRTNTIQLQHQIKWQHPKYRLHYFL